MKTFYIHSESLSDILSMLWDGCSEMRARIDLDPASNLIQIVKGDTVVASITPLVVTDEYDLRRELQEL